MTPFEPAPEGYQAHWDDLERIVVASITLEVAGLLAQQAAVPDVAESDPLAQLFAEATAPRELTDSGVQRLLPDAFRGPEACAARQSDDDVAAEDETAQASAEFRRLTQNDLARAKLQGLHRWAKLLTADQRNIDHGLVIVPRASAKEVAAALTDIRLVLADRLGLKTDDDVEALNLRLYRGRLGHEGRDHLARVFFVVGLAQESLVEAMLKDLRSGRQNAP